MRITNDVSNTSGSQSGKQPLKPASYEINTLARYVILLDKITENNRVPSFEPITLEELEKKGFGTLKEEIQKIQGELRECIHASIPFHKRLLDHISASLPVAGPSGFGYIQRFNPPTFGTSSTPSSPKINRDTGNISTGFISVIRKSITDLEADPSFVDDIFCRENLTTLILENVSKKEQGNVLLLVKDVLRVYHEIITKRPEVSNLRSIFRIDWHEVRDDSKDSLCLSADTISALSNLQPKKLQDGLVRMNKFYGFLWHFRNSFQNVRDCFESLLKKESWSRRSGQPPASNPAEQLELSIYDYYHTSESTNGQCLAPFLNYFFSDEPDDLNIEIPYQLYPLPSRPITVKGKLLINEKEAPSDAIGIKGILLYGVLPDGTRVVFRDVIAERWKSQIMANLWPWPVSPPTILLMINDS